MHLTSKEADRHDRTPEAGALLERLGERERMESG
jgi:hypothetical protein